MDDEGIPRRTLLGCEDFSDSGGRESVRAKAVDGFGGESYGAPGAEDFSGSGDVGGVVGVEMEGWWHFWYGSGSEARA